MAKISDKSDDNQSEARISVAYNTNCHLSLMKICVKHPPVIEYEDDSMQGVLYEAGSNPTGIIFTYSQLQIKDAIFIYWV